MNWYDNPANVLRLAKHLETAGEIETALEAIDLFESPGRYTDDWEQMLADEHNAEQERERQARSHRYQP